MATTDQTDTDWGPPAVAYNPDANEYLVTWDNDASVYAGRVSAAGAVLGAGVISSGAYDDIETTDVAWSSSAQRYLVVWKGGPSGDGGQVFSRLLGPDGTPASAGDVTVGGGPNVGVNDAVSLTYNATDHEFLVVFRADTDSGYHIFGQLISTSGAEVGADDFLISSEDNDSRPKPPSVIWNSHDDQYLVTWSDQVGDADNPAVYGQLLSSTGTRIGNPDFAISDMPDLNTNRPGLAYDPNADQYLVTWHNQRSGGEDRAGAGLAPLQAAPTPQTVWGIGVKGRRNRTPS